MVNEPSEVTAITQDRPEPSPPMAVLPLNPSAKLDQEPNPFEESFSTVANTTTATPLSSNNNTKKPVLPPVAAITSPVPPLLRSGVLPKDVANQFAWDSLHTGPLSPSMLQGPSRPSIPQQQGQEHMSSTRDNHERLNNNTTTNNDDTKRSGSLCSGSSSSSSSSSSNTTITGENHHANKKRPRSNSKDEDDEKRRNFLERNRIAALKCRQRKKKWLSNLQTRVEYLTNDNEQLQMQANTLREEIVHLKTLLLAHKDCPVATGNNPAVAVAAAAAAANNITADTHPHPQRQQCISGASTSPSQHHLPHHNQSSIMTFPVTSSASRVWRY
ncbi:hypothetical protein K492DRAFT_210951 [Lichtheimia hyalospora FSU 10163]|nr:hypothetical protein K492DRAFT_210951 [Lichtheimia hyalospora FSU 10163]